MPRNRSALIETSGCRALGLGAAAAGAGTTSTATMRWAVAPTYGPVPDVTVTDSATEGTTFACNQPGVYHAHVEGQVPAATTVVAGIALGGTGPFTANPVTSTNGVLVAQTVTTLALQVLSFALDAIFEVDDDIVGTNVANVVRFLGTNGAAAIMVATNATVAMRLNRLMDQAGG